MSLRSSFLAPLVVTLLALVPVAACTSREAAPPAPASASASARPSATGPLAADPASKGATSADAVGACRREGAKLDADFAAAYAAAPRSCRADADCVLARPHCSRCGSGGVLASGQVAYEKGIKPLEAACDAFASGPCATIDPQPMPSCAAYRPVCSAGTCGAEIRVR
jgi:hypothetical protein